MQVKNDVINSIDKFKSKSSCKDVETSSKKSESSFDDCVKSSKKPQDEKEQKIESVDTVTEQKQEKIENPLKTDAKENEANEVNESNGVEDKSEKLEDMLMKLLNMLLHKSFKESDKSSDVEKETVDLKVNVEDTKKDDSLEKLLQQINGINALYKTNEVPDLSKLIDVSKDKQLKNIPENNLISIIKDFASENGVKLNPSDLKDMSKMIQDLSKNMGSNDDFLKILKSLQSLDLKENSISKIIDRIKENTLSTIEKPIDSNKGNVLSTIDKPTDSSKENVLSVGSKQKDSAFENSASNSEKPSFEVNGNTLKTKNVETKSTDFINIMQQNTSDKKVTSVEAKEIANVREPQDIIDITVNKFKALRLPEITEVSVKLKPEQLGEISVKLVLEKGHINGQISAETKEVVNVLQNGIDNLKEQLKNSNVNLNNISVNISSEDNFENRHNRGQFTQQNKNDNKDFEEVFADSIEQEEEQAVNIIA